MAMMLGEGKALESEAFWAFALVSHNPDALTPCSMPTAHVSFLSSVS